MNRRLCLLALFATATASAGDTVKLAGHVHHTSGKSVVYVALWRADGFLEKPAQTLRIAAGSNPSYAFDVAPGQWAVSSFEDTNGNGVLDMGMFGPKEPSGFWRAFTVWHKPKFDEVSARVDRDILDADITLR